MHPVIRKLSVFASFSQVEESAVALALGNIHVIKVGQSFGRQDDRPDGLRFLISGFACRHKLIENGQRQILSFMLPGDGCDMGVTLLERRDHSLTALTTCRVAFTSDEAMEHVLEQYPKLKAAFRWASLVEESISREWIANVGQREAAARAAHVFCELYYRWKAIGQAEGMNFELPITQADLADALGISVVHANRTLQELRHRKLIAFGDGRLTILNLEELEQLAEFDLTYLHLEARYDGSSAGATSPT